MSSVFNTTAFGSFVLSTTGAPPNSVGINGQLAFDSTARTLYGPKSAGVWPAGVALQGGLILSGAGVPANSLGTNGDFYYRSNGDWYGPKAGGVWSSPAFNTTGPTGATGATGPSGGLTARIPATVATTSVAVGGTWTGQIALTPGFIIYSIQLSFPGWLRVYPTAAARTADATRLQNEDSVGSVTAEIATGTVDQIVFPNRSAVAGSNQDIPRTNLQYLALRNLDSVARIFTITVSYVALEVAV